MTDTTAEARKKQLEVIMSMSPLQRFMEGIQMIDDVRYIVESSIKAQNPGISEKELKAEVFRRYYKNDFTPLQLEAIVNYLMR
jgi:hypothetical protein